MCSLADALADLRAALDAPALAHNPEVIASRIGAMRILTGRAIAWDAFDPHPLAVSDSDEARKMREALRNDADADASRGVGTIRHQRFADFSGDGWLLALLGLRLTQDAIVALTESALALANACDECNDKDADAERYAGALAARAAIGDALHCFAHRIAHACEQSHSDALRFGMLAPMLADAIDRMTDVVERRDTRDAFDCETSSLALLCDAMTRIASANDARRGDAIDERERIAREQVREIVLRYAGTMEASAPVRLVFDAFGIDGVLDDGSVPPDAGGIIQARSLRRGAVRARIRAALAAYSGA